MFFLRLAVAVVFIFHAVPKIRDTKKVADSMGWMPGQVLVLGLLEFIAAMGILGGVAVRSFAFLLVVIMCAAIFHKIKKWHVPFISHNSTGWELDFLLLLANLTIYFRY